MAFVEIDNLGVLGYVATHFGNLNFQIFHFCYFGHLSKMIIPCYIVFHTL